MPAHPFLPSESKAIHWLSGDQRGVPHLPMSVSLRGAEPSKLLTQISVRSPAPDMNTSFLPSGEGCGPAIVEPTDKTSCGAFAGVAWRSNRQIAGLGRADCSAANFSFRLACETSASSDLKRFGPTHWLTTPTLTRTASIST